MDIEFLEELKSYINSGMSRNDLKTVINKKIKAEQLNMHDVILSLREQLIERYSALLTKNYKYQMGDDDFALTTEELRICRPLNIILQDLKN